MGAYPSKIPMIDVVTVGAGGGSVAWVSPEGSLKVGPQSAGADPGPLCYGLGGTEPTITDAHVVLGRIPPHLLGGEIPLDVEPPAPGSIALAGTARARPRAVRRRACSRSRRGTRPTPCGRSRSSEGSTSATSCSPRSAAPGRSWPAGSSTSSASPASSSRPNPGNLSAFGLLTVDVRNDYVQTHVARHTSLDLGAVRSILEALTGRAAAALDAEGFAPGQHGSSAPPTCATSARPTRSGCRPAPGRSTPPGPRRSPAASTTSTAALYGYDFRDDPAQQVEWVNLRVTGIGPITRPDLRPLPERGAGEPVGEGLPGQRSARGSASTPTPATSRRPCSGGPTCAPATPSAGRPSSRSSARPSPSTPASPSASTRWGNLVLTKEDAR